MQNILVNREFPVLVASSDISYATVLTDYLEVDGYQVEKCYDAKAVLREVGKKLYSIVVLDLELGDDGDVDLVSFTCRQVPYAQIILLFEISLIERAIEGIRAGASFYLPKSSMPSDVALVVDKAARSLKTQARATRYEQTIFEELLGNTPGMRRVVELITKVAPTDSTVLLLGESGTGKEVFANMVHRMSPRRDGPFVAINCAALPEALLESEMFGHVKGAFTGAEQDKMGLFEGAESGTIFLDEIGDMSLVVQAKLLRVLQNGEVRRVGSSDVGKVDVRVVAATNRNLIEAVQNKEFREDLYFRLNVIQIRIPPLRERMDTLGSLVSHFIELFNTKFNRNVRHIDEQAQLLLQNYHFAGNVRELESIMAHAVIMCDSDTISTNDLPEQLREEFGWRLALPDHSDRILTMEEAEDGLIRSALGKLNGNQSEVAKALGISRSTLWRKMKQYDISAK